MKKILMITALGVALISSKAWAGQISFKISYSHPKTEKISILHNRKHLQEHPYQAKLKGAPFKGELKIVIPSFRNRYQASSRFFRNQIHKNLRNMKKISARHKFSKLKKLCKLHRHDKRRARNSCVYDWVK